jgi:hypothetical protein
MKFQIHIAKSLVIALAALSLGGCASLSPPPNNASVDHYHDYVGHRDIGAPPGSPYNPDAGAGVIASLLQYLVH